MQNQISSKRVKLFNSNYTVSSSLHERFITVTNYVRIARILDMTVKETESGD